MNLKKFMAVSPLLLGIGFIFGMGLAYAKIIPGVDRPYDPGAYYSPDVVSVADSPSTFTMRDLASPGGSVYDHQRHENSIPFKNDFVNIVQSYINRTLFKKQNSTPLSADKINEVNEVINIKQDDIIEIYRNNAAKAIENSKAFRSSDDYTEREYSKQEQAKIVEEQYRLIASDIQKITTSNHKEDQALRNILNNTTNTMGKLEADQLILQIQALQEAENAKKSALLAKLIQIRNMEQRIERDERIKANRQAEDSKLYIVDPYNKEEFTRPTSVGFQSFK